MFKKLSGIIGNFFRVGLSGNAIKDHANGIEIRNGGDTASANIVIARATSDTHGTTYLDLKERAILLEFSFDGASPPSAGDNTGKYGLCHTADVGYDAGSVWYDTGSALTEVTVYKAMAAASTTAISGTVSMIANGLYIAQAATAPYSWTLKGDASLTGAGYIKTIEVAVTATKGNFDSTEVIPDGAVVLSASCSVTTLYDGSATIAVSANGSSPVTLMSTSENNPAAVEIYEVEQRTDIGSTGTGVVRVVLGGGTVTVGAAVVHVQYVTPLA